MIINPAPPAPGETSGGLEERRPEDFVEYELNTARGIAAELNAAEERWFVMYGAGSRSYWAFPLWDPGLPMVLESGSPQRLVAAMRETEAKQAARQAARQAVT